jgi:hypothetical protein
MGEHQPSGKTRRRSAAESKPEVVDETCGSSCPGRQQVVVKSFCKDMPTTEHGVAAEPTDLDQQPNWTTSER